MPAGDPEKDQRVSPVCRREEDPLLDYLLKLEDRMGKAQGLLTDDNVTAFFFLFE